MPFADCNKRTQTPTDYSIVLENQPMNYQTRSPFSRKNHPVWQDLTEVLENLDTKVLVTEHLESCDYKICGYWDEQDTFYEEITLPHSLSAELVGTSIGITGINRWIKLQFILKADRRIHEDWSNANSRQNLGELTIIYDENLQFID